MKLSKPVSRITLAVTLSALLHGAALFLFQVEIKSGETLLPPLSARLEPLPAKIEQGTPKIKPANPPAQLDETLTAAPEPLVTEFASIASAVVSTPEPEPGKVSAIAPAVVNTPEPETESTPIETDVVAPAAHPSLPKHAQLKFVVYLGQDSFQVGEMIHRLEINEDKYILRSETETTGLARLLKSYHLIQTSQGRVGDFGLQPSRYEEEQNTSGDRQKTSVTFDWVDNRLRYFHGGEAALPQNAQDILSVLYQLSQSSLVNEVVSVAISTKKKIEWHELEIGTEEEIVTQLGKLRALPLRRLHNQDEEGMEIWLGLEYRLLPVKFRQLKRSGEVIFEVVISEIRVADE